MMTSNSSYASTTSLDSNKTVTSMTPLVPAKPNKDYSTAFADLQSRYGTAGNFPAPVMKPSASQKQNPSLGTPQSTSYPSSQSTSTPLTTSPKNFEASFGKLSSSYGFGGAMPKLPRKDKESKAKKMSFFTSKGGSRCFFPLCSLIFIIHFSGN